MLEKVYVSSCEVREQKLTLIITAQLGNSPETMHEREKEREIERGDTVCPSRAKTEILPGWWTRFSRHRIDGVQLIRERLSQAHVSYVYAYKRRTATLRRKRH